MSKPRHRSAGYCVFMIFLVCSVCQAFLGLSDLSVVFACGPKTAHGKRVFLMTGVGWGGVGWGGVGWGGVGWGGVGWGGVGQDVTVL